MGWGWDLLPLSLLPFGSPPTRGLQLCWEGAWGGRGRVKASLQDSTPGDWHPVGTTDLPQHSFNWGSSEDVDKTH